MAHIQDMQQFSTFQSRKRLARYFLVIAMLSILKIYAVEFFFLTCLHALGLTLQVSSFFFTVNAHSLQLLLQQICANIF